ncbi:hypothetical protein HAX54_041156 [Datura stramonium]|uniref:Uncharacterized protein n=1 Tax=Datura stramonium TaxID=4076 RepID=A0ABS8SL34_DATST|nr:hypothetical protein [Datura stramonium]
MIINANKYYEFLWNPSGTMAQRGTPKKGLTKKQVSERSQPSHRRLWDVPSSSEESSSSEEEYEVSEEQLITDCGI